MCKFIFYIYQANSSQGIEKSADKKFWDSLFFMTRLVTKNALANECQWHRGIPQHAFCEDMPRKAIDIHLLRHTIPKLRVMKEGVKKNRPRDFFTYACRAASSESQISHQPKEACHKIAYTNCFRYPELQGYILPGTPSQCLQTMT